MRINEVAWGILWVIVWVVRICKGGMGVIGRTQERNGVGGIRGEVVCRARLAEDFRRIGKQCISNS